MGLASFLSSRLRPVVTGGCIRAGIGICSLALAACGFKFIDAQEPVSISFISTDSDGNFTAKLAQALVEGGIEVSESAGLELKANVLRMDYSNVGFRKARGSNYEQLKHITASEGRYKLVVELSLVNKLSEEVVRGPYSVEVLTDFDFQSDMIRRNETQFSLGQLDTLSEAQANAAAAVYRKLAREVAFWLYSSS